MMLSPIIKRLQHFLIPKQIYHFFYVELLKQIMILFNLQEIYLDKIFQNNFKKGQINYSKKSFMISLFTKQKCQEKYLSKFVMIVELMFELRQLIIIIKTLLPVQYEPILLHWYQNQMNKQLIIQKHKMIDNRVIWNCSNIVQQKLQQNLDQLQVQQEQGLIKNISQLLENYSVYINLVYLCNNHLKNKSANLPPYLSAISQICLQILQDINLPQTSNSNYEIFAKQLDETLCFNSFQVESDAQRAYRSQIKRSRFSNQIAETSTQLITENCSLCQLQFENEEINIELLIQYSNIYMIPKPIKINSYIDIFEVVASSCQHTFHKQCLQLRNKNLRQACLNIKDVVFACHTIFLSITNAKDKILIQILEFFLLTLTDKKNETFSLVLCNLLFQLLSDLNKFNQKTNHIFQYKVLALLRIVYHENQTTIFQEIVENDQDIFFQNLELTIAKYYKVKQYQTFEIRIGSNSL
ncbi:unnamed protein product [Paramecium primaurelia]|uniref:Uncharacterized protein n=1 Tax=Paramecium primaurelia TaxID=5886 RepID=A0A8S1P767_PARPR|nr:unnamed protein product [Paramecium primaurelia]